MKGVISYVVLGRIITAVADDPRSGNILVDELPEGKGCRLINTETKGRWRQLDLVTKDYNQELEIYYVHEWVGRCVYANDVPLCVERVLGYLFEEFDTVEVPGAIEIIKKHD